MRSFLTRRAHRAGPAAAMRAPRVGDSDCCTALGPGGVKPGVKSRSLAAPVPIIPPPTHTLPLRVVAEFLAAGGRPPLLLLPLYRLVAARRSSLGLGGGGSTAFFVPW